MPVSCTGCASLPMQGDVLAARSAAQPGPAPLPCAGQRGAARPPPPVRWRYRLCNHVCRGMGKNPNTNKRNNPRSVRNAGSQPGGNGAQLRDAPFPRETPGVAGSPAAAAGAWFSGATRAKLGAREPAGQSWGSGRRRPAYRESILSGTGRKRRPVPSRGAERNPRVVSSPAPVLFLLSRKLLVRCPQPAWVLMAGCLISATLPS